jgi:hypothetical protein
VPDSFSNREFSLLGLKFNQKKLGRVQSLGCAPLVMRNYLYKKSTGLKRRKHHRGEV